MKKLSVLIASLLCVTIGGVYATWYYASSSNVLDRHEHIGLDITADQTQGGYGSYTVSPKVGMWIDPKSEDSYEAALYFGTANESGVVTPAQPTDAAIVITYTPDTYVPDDIDAYGITSYYSFSWKKEGCTALADWKFNNATESDATDDKQIFTKIGDDTAITIYPHGTAGQTATWSEKDDDGKFTYTITVKMLSNLIQLNSGIVLDTVAKYNAFQGNISGATIGITVNDGVADPTTGS